MNYEYDGTFFRIFISVFDAWHDGIEKQRVSARKDLYRYLTSRGLYAPIRARPGGSWKHSGSSAAAGPVISCTMRLWQNSLTEDPLLLYLRLAFRYKNKFLHHLSDEPIWTVRQMARKTGNERHKLLGLLRFRELSDGMLYARLAPSCAVVPLMAPHFVSRFPEERWVIHDVRRHMASCMNHTVCP